MTKRINTIQSDDNILLFEILPSRTIGDMVYPLVLFIIWIGGYFMVTDKLSEYTGPAYEYFTMLISAFWILIATFVFYIIFWKLFGKEFVCVDKNELKIKRSILGIGTSSTFKLDEVTLLSVSSSVSRDVSQSMNINFFGITGGSLSFVYNGDIKQFGLQLPRKEAEEVLEMIKRIE